MQVGLFEYTPEQRPQAQEKMFRLDLLNLPYRVFEDTTVVRIFVAEPSNSIGFDTHRGIER